MLRGLFIRLSAQLALGVEMGTNAPDKRAELDAGAHVERARPRQGDRDRVHDPSRPRRHDQDAVGEEDRLGDRMGDEEHGLAPLEPDALELEVHALARHGVERAERLVHEQHGGIVDEAAGDRDALLHAARELPGIAVLEALEPDEGEELERARPHPLASQPLHVDRQQHVVEHGAPGEEHGRLEDDADVAPRAADRRPAEIGPALRRRDEAGEDLEERRLAAARGPHHGDELPLGHAEVDVVQRQHRAARGLVLLAEPLDGDHLAGRARHLSSRRGLSSAACPYYQAGVPARQQGSRPGNRPQQGRNRRELFAIDAVKGRMTVCRLRASRQRASRPMSRTS